MNIRVGSFEVRNKDNKPFHIHSAEARRRIAEGIIVVIDGPGITGYKTLNIIPEFPQHLLAFGGHVREMEDGMVIALHCIVTF